LRICVIAAFFASFSTLAVSADGTCSTCNEPAFPEAAVFLAGKGYPVEAYSILLTWTERLSGGTGGVATGYHVLQRETSVAFDLYSDAAGNLLDEKSQRELGIREKNWDLPPIEQKSEIPAPIKKRLSARPTPVAAKTFASSASVSLPALDVASLLEEDEARASGPGKGVQRIGVTRTFSNKIVVSGCDAPSIGEWRTMDDGTRVWSLKLESPEAKALRVHFATLVLPFGGKVIVYNENNPTEAYGPYTRPYSDETDFWSASVFSSAVVVELSVPASVSCDSLKLIIDDVVHTYADFGLLAWTKASGTCHEDVSCHDEWATTATGVGGFTFISKPDQLHCTGALIADTDSSSDIPYFLTANHCISSQTGKMGASSMEFYWLYQTSSCGGDVPSLSEVPRNSDGADFLAGVSSSTGSDFTLVRMRSTPSADVAYLGWSSQTVTGGTSVVAIHHPQGDYKRISFGITSESGSPSHDNSPVKPYEYFSEVLWNIGSTESGSSGSPLFLEDSRKLVGQLWGGYASCSKPEEPDYFGRFEKTYSVLSPWLSPEADPMDVDESGTIDSVDVQLVVNDVLGMSIRYNADVNRSGAVDAVDVQLIILAVLEELSN
jgi:hypothetical protein